MIEILSKLYNGQDITDAPIKGRHLVSTESLSHVWIVGAQWSAAAIRQPCARRLGPKAFDGDRLPVCTWQDFVQMMFQQSGDGKERGGVQG